MKGFIRIAVLAVAASALCGPFASAQTLSSPTAARADRLGGIIPTDILDSSAKLAFSPNAPTAVIVEGTSGRIVSISNDGSLRETATFTAPEGIEELALSGDGILSFVTGVGASEASGAIRPADGSRVSSVSATVMWSQYASTPPQPHMHTVAAISLDGRVALSWVLSRDGVTRHLVLIDVPSSRVRATLGWDIGEGGFTNAALSPAGNRVAVVQQNQGRGERRRVILFDAATGRILAQQDFLRPSDPVFDQEGRTLALSVARSEQDLRRQVVVWQPGGPNRSVLQLPTVAQPRAIALTPDGTQLAAADGTSLSLWEVTTGRQIATVPFAATTEVRISQDGRFLATVGRQTVVWGPGSIDQLLSSAASDRSGARSFHAFLVLSEGLGVARDDQRASEMMDRAIAAGYLPAIDSEIARLDRRFRSGDALQCSRVATLHRAAQQAGSRQLRRSIFSECGLPGRR